MCLERHTETPHVPRGAHEVPNPTALASQCNRSLITHRFIMLPGLKGPSEGRSRPAEPAPIPPVPLPPTEPTGPKSPPAAQARNITVSDTPGATTCHSCQPFA
jgi:hypothetical protein